MTVLAAARRLPGTPLQRVGLILAVLVPATVLVADLPGLEAPAQRMLAVFSVAVILWVTEAIPLVATAVLVIFLQVLLISDEAVIGLDEVAFEAPTAASIYATLAHPVIILFLGGFLLADGAAKYRLDRNLTAVMLRPFRGSLRLTVLGLMLITAGLSAFMSNTATTATMLAVLIPVLAVSPSPAARTGLALSIPVAATVGGLLTPVSSPPNAIAVGTLADQGIRITFVDWLLATGPLVMVLLVVAWAVLSVRYLDRGVAVDIDVRVDLDTRPRAVLFYVVAGLTVVLWLTEAAHGIPAATVAFLPVTVLLATSVMTGEDLRRLQWPVLWLVAGGIALGSGVAATGLDEWMIGLVDWATLPGLAVTLGLLTLALLLGTLISNSATANLLIPLVPGLAVTVGSDSVILAVALAVVCGLGMALPVSTPPNAIAYATGEIRTKDMAAIGIVVGVVGLVLVAFVMPAWWSLTGLT
ncbi:DASS family sodium-coupled anion symporter [Dietzia sp. 111N12-1]|uniref:SLC13 family permease n=1 Tax=Dietzia sp. 111N12-1 TaxID=1785156 RepID=UPI0008059EDD|nr:DASS family sodium-coupled anion symporter [Dietzia sp. 111N12-1]OAV76569.1 transporter [Dietzia sp. 111N12-1]